MIRAFLDLQGAEGGSGEGEDGGEDGEQRGSGEGEDGGEDGEQQKSKISSEVQVEHLGENAAAEVTGTGEESPPAATATGDGA